MSAGRRLSLTGGVVAAFAFSIAGAALLAVLGPILGIGIIARGVIALLGFAYVLYLVGRSGERVGRISTIACWLVCTALALLVDLPFMSFVLVHVGLVWLVRSLYYYSGLLPALIDFGLSLLGTAFAVWSAQRTGSFGLALWCFFLAQAFHALIPASVRPGPGHSEAEDAFARAHRAAESAVRRLSGAA
jgi:hypothetical protein